MYVRHMRKVKSRETIHIFAFRLRLLFPRYPTYDLLPISFVFPVVLVSFSSTTAWLQKL